MHQFIKRHENNIRGVLSGFDRMRFRGTLRWLANIAGMASFMKGANLLLKDFTDYAKGVTQRRLRSDATFSHNSLPVMQLRFEDASGW